MISFSKLRAVQFIFCTCGHFEEIWLSAWRQGHFEPVSTTIKFFAVAPRIRILISSLNKTPTFPFIVNPTLSSIPVSYYPADRQCSQSVQLFATHLASNKSVPFARFNFSVVSSRLFISQSMRLLIHLDLGLILNRTASGRNYPVRNRVVANLSRAGERVTLLDVDK